MNVVFQKTETAKNQSIFTHFVALIYLICIIVNLLYIINDVYNNAYKINSMWFIISISVTLYLFYMFINRISPNTFFIIYDDEKNKYYIRWRKFHKWNIFINNDKTEYGFDSYDKSKRIVTNLILKKPIGIEDLT